MADAPDGQISLTDPDARSMATSARHSGLVGYNVQSAVDVETHLIVAHDAGAEMVGRCSRQSEEVLETQSASQCLLLVDLKIDRFENMG